ncbi:MAG: EF-hand domain-containing protein [Chthoniobacteraceae bacterium]
MKTRLPFLFVSCVFACVSLAPLHAAELPGAGALADLVVKQFDTNGDSKIDSGELQAGVASSFAEIDADGDGKITVAEIDALGDVLGKEIGETVAAVVMKLIKPLILSMDSDKDGAVSRDEFLKAAVALFARLDTNKDAEITRAELLLLPLKMLLPAAK